MKTDKILNEILQSDMVGTVRLLFVLWRKATAEVWDTLSITAIKR